MPIKLKISKTRTQFWQPFDIVHVQAGDVSFDATHWVYSDQSNRGMLPKIVFSMNNVQTAILTGELAIQFDEWENP